jgi:hypothetical protein
MVTIYVVATNLTLSDCILSTNCLGFLGAGNFESLHESSVLIPLPRKFDLDHTLHSIAVRSFLILSPISSLCYEVICDIVVYQNKLIKYF